MLATHPLAWVAGDYCLAVATQLPHERWNDRIGAPPDHTPALRCEHSGFFDFRSPLLLYCQGLRLRAIVLRQQLLGCCSSAAAAVRCLRGPRPPRVDGPESSRRPLPAAAGWLLPGCYAGCEAQLLGMLKIPLFAAPTVKFPELRFLVVLQTCQHVVQTCAPAEMLGGLLKSQEINVTDTVLVNLSLLTTGNLY